MIVVKTQMEEMPRDCYKCPFAMFEYWRFHDSEFKPVHGIFRCVATGKTITSTKRNRFCPLAKMDEVEE